MLCSASSIQLAKSFGELIRALCTHGRDHDVVAPTDIKRLVGSYAPRFLGYNQQDSQEFLRFLLDGLHEDLNLVRQVCARLCVRLCGIACFMCFL